MNFFSKQVVIEVETLREEEREKEFEEEEKEKEEKRCKADDCKINSCKGDEIQWVSCDVCRSWWHLFCLDLSTTPKNSLAQNAGQILRLRFSSEVFIMQFIVFYCVFLSLAT